jgi:hypothetical protein
MALKAGFVDEYLSVAGILIPPERDHLVVIIALARHIGLSNRRESQQQCDGTRDGSLVHHTPQTVGPDTRFHNSR